jgi:hypothetical protein
MPTTKQREIYHFRELGFYLEAEDWKTAAIAVRVTSQIFIA